MNHVDRNLKKIEFLRWRHYVLEVFCFVKKYKGNLKQNVVIHEHNTRSKYDMYTQFCNALFF